MRKRASLVGEREKNLNIQQCVLNLRPTAPLTFTPYPHACPHLNKQKAHLAGSCCRIRNVVNSWTRADMLPHAWLTEPLPWDLPSDFLASSRASPAMRSLSGGHMGLYVRSQSGFSWCLKISKPLRTSSPSFTVNGSAFPDCGKGLVLAFPFVMEQIRQVKLCQGRTSCLIYHHDQRTLAAKLFSTFFLIS